MNPIETLMKKAQAAQKEVNLVYCNDQGAEVLSTGCSRSSLLIVEKITEKANFENMSKALLKRECERLRWIPYVVNEGPVSH